MEEINLIQLKIDLLRYAKIPQVPHQMSAYLKRLQWLAKQQTEQHSLHCYFQQLITHRYTIAVRTTPEEQEEIIKIKEALCHDESIRLYGTTNKIYYNLCLLFCDYMLGKNDRTSELNATLLRCWQEKPDLICFYNQLFVRSASIQAYSHFLSHNTEGAANYLMHYKELAHQYLTPPFYSFWFNVIAFNSEIKVLHKKYLYEELAQRFLPEWPAVYELLWVVPEAEKLDIIISGSITYFVLKKWNEAESLMLEAKELNHKVQRTDTLYFSFVFHCLILFEQREWSRLHNLINTEYHFLYSHNRLRPFERDMLLFIKKLPVVMLKENRKAGFEIFLQKLNTYKENEHQKLHFAFFDFYTWIESKMHGMDYTIFVKQKASAHNLE